MSKEDRFDADLQPQRWASLHNSIWVKVPTQGLSFMQAPSDNAELSSSEVKTVSARKQYDTFGFAKMLKGCFVHLNVATK